MNVKYILGTITIATIIGGTIYMIKKSKDLEAIEEGEITLAEARSIVAEKETKSVTTNSQTDMKKAVISARKTAYDEEIDEEEEEEDEETDIEVIDECESYAYEKPTEEDAELRYEPSSRDARNQFIRMELAEWVPLEDVYQTLLNLFEFPFNPINDGDRDLKTRIIDYRAQFFGFDSKWTREVTIADIILHYARLAEFNGGESVRYWAEYFLDFNEFELMTPSHVIDKLLKSLNSHVYFNEERQTFGLFGLTSHSMDQAIKIANRNIDNSVTYEIEFNEFLKSCL
jgi:hypothetical protein